MFTHTFTDWPVIEKSPHSICQTPSGRKHFETRRCSSPNDLGRWLRLESFWPQTKSRRKTPALVGLSGTRVCIGGEFLVTLAEAQAKFTCHPTRPPGKKCETAVFVATFAVTVPQGQPAEVRHPSKKWRPDAEDRWDRLDLKKKCARNLPLNFEDYKLT